MNTTSLLSGLGTAIAADPALGSANAAAGQAAPGTADLFLSLVEGLLNGAPTAATAQPVAAPATGGVATEVPATDTEEAVLPTRPLAPAAAQIPGLVAAAPVDGPAVPAGPAEADSRDDDDPDLNAPTDATAYAIVSTIVPAALAAPVAQTTPAIESAETVDGTVSGPATPVPTVSGQSQAGDAGTGQGGDRPTDRPLDPGVDDTAAPATVHVARSEQATTPQITPSVSGPTVAATAATAATTTTTTTPVNTPVADQHQVTRQVFPEVLRVTTSSQGTEGTQRITVKLNPESLGEVRVVLTSRRDGLEVRLAGGSDAQRAMAEGAPELRRLLESVGRTDSRIVIHDLPGVAPAAGSTQAPAPVAAARTDVSTDLTGGFGTGTGRSDGDPGGEQSSRHPSNGSSTATDGAPVATIPSRRTETVTRGTSGLDVTM